MRQREKPARRKGPKPFVIGMLIGVPVMALSVTAIVGSMSQSKYDRPMRDPVYDRPAYTAHAKAPGDVDFSSSGIAYGTADKMTVIDIADLGETPDGSTNGGRGYAVEDYAGVYMESGGAISSPQESQDIQEPPDTPEPWTPSEWGPSLEEDTGGARTDPGDSWTIHEVEDSGGDTDFVPRNGNDISDQIWKDDHVTTYNSFTQREAVADSGGKLGKLSIPAIGLEANIYQSDSGEMEAMRHGIAHYNTTSSWDGNVGLCSHNWSPSGNGAYFQDLNKLKKGDTITYTTDLGTRTYIVSTIATINGDDWSYLNRTDDNRVTLTTCDFQDDSKRLCVQAVEM